ncbi:hypothetical protein AVEN_135016-2-1, partial [Araneus ventricosus]
WLRLGIAEEHELQEEDYEIYLLTVLLIRIVQKLVFRLIAIGLATGGFHPNKHNCGPVSPKSSQQTTQSHILELNPTSTSNDT